jgi:hypothetical protein
MRGHLGLRPDLLDHQAHGLVRHTRLPSDSPQSLPLNLGGDLRPALSWDTRSFPHYCVPANSRSPSRVEESLRIQKWDEPHRDHIYLA